MPRTFKVFWYSCFFIILFGIVAGITAYSRGVRAGTGDNGSGFLWTDTFGWISLNCINGWGTGGAREDRCAQPPGDYGVHIDLGRNPGTVSGRGWSPHLGWVCFGSTCGGTAPGGALPNISFDLNSVTPVLAGGNMVLFSGWARAETLATLGQQYGWIRFSGATEEGTDIQVGMRPTGTGALAVAGAAWQRNPDMTGAGWVYFGDPPPGNAPRRQTPGSEAEVRGEDVPSALIRYTTENLMIDGVSGCTDNRDNDEDDGINTLDDDPQTVIREFSGDGRDCLDYDCAGAPNCSQNESRDADGTPATTQCFDGIDNDLDAWVPTTPLTYHDDGRIRYVESSSGGIDCADPDCRDVFNPNNRNDSCGGIELCWDDEDNDRDGDADCADDDCAGFVTCNPRNLRVGHARCSDDLGCVALGNCVCSTNCADADRDQVCDSADNCGRPGTALRPNSGQADIDTDGIGDACDAFFRTEQGALYAHGISGVAPPAGSFLATYCVFTEFDSFTPFNIRTRSCALPADSSATILGFRLRQYNDTLTLLAALSEEGLRARLQIAQLRPERPGVVNLTGPPAADIHAILRNPSSSRYYYRGDLEINDDIQIPAGRGGITILVEGNLSFGAGAKVSYVGGDEQIRDVTSLAWIVLDNPDTANNREGNVYIDPGVGSADDPPDLAGAHLVGTFVASGVFHTGAGDNPLTIGGLIVAREFRLERTFRTSTGEARPAELIIYDGRALLNPPPGLADLIKTLPQLRAVAPR